MFLQAIIERLHTDSVTLRFMSRYGVGVVGNWPMFDLFLRAVGVSDEERHKANVAYLVSFVFFGIGVFLGRVVRSVQ